MDNLQNTSLKDYYLEEQIGSGGFGAVYRARQTTVNREVAVKVILPGYANNPDFIRRFETEAQLIARLEHPHITPLIDYWRDPKGAYLVMRYLRGGSLRQSLATESYELNTISVLLDQVASALDFAHRSNVIHRDIKPGNILLDEDGNAYLADFGIAKDLQTTKENQTATDAVVGSLDYISPEQARSEPVTSRTDIYSLGVTLYEMITGEHPFKEASSIERLYKHINDPLPDITDLPDDVCDNINDIIQKATAKDPTRRYPDVLAFAVAFRESIGRNSSNKQERLIEQLTMREHEILALMTDGLTNAQIAEQLFITTSTVKWHISQLYKKLEVTNRVQAIIRGRELNLIAQGDSLYDLQAHQTLSSDISLPEPQNPYKGLHAFQITDSQDFFGRDDLVNKLVNRMQEQNAYSRFLAVTGPSGSGKSSIVRAGLIPALWKGALSGSEKWFIIDLIPGRHPLDKLETALIRVAANQAENLREQLQRDERGLLRVADIILPNDDTELVIVIDQFEEVFTLLEDEAERQHFLDLLRTATTEDRSRVRIIITLRADYYDRPLHYPEFGALMRERLETVLPLSAKGLERAIRGPAERVAVTFEQGLVEQIVSKMNYQAGALPLLQYALTELFNRREGRLLTHDAYQQIGGAVGALANRADEIYNSLTNEGQELAQQMFMRLVALGEGAEDTRRRTTHAELLNLTNNTDLMEEIIEQFADYRLLSLDHDRQTRQPTVEVAHEAILREWKRLRSWINNSRTDLHLQHQLIGWMEDWQQANQERSYLLRDARLEQFETWSKETNIILTSDEKQFIDKSLEARSKRSEEERKRQNYEAQLEKRSQQRMQYLLVAVSVLLIVAVAFSIFALDRQKRISEVLDDVQRESDVNRSLVLSNDAMSAYELGTTDLALLIALEAVNLDSPPPEALRVLSNVSRGIGTRYVLNGHTHTVTVMAISHDSQFLATGSCAVLNENLCEQGEIIVWDLQGGTQAWHVNASIHAGWITGLAFSPDASLLAVSSEDGVIGLWQITDGELFEQFDTQDSTVNSLDYHPVESQIVTANADGSILLWDVETAEVIREFEGHSSSVNDIQFNTDGTQLLSGGTDSLVILWDTATSDILQIYQQTEESEIPIENVAFDETNHRILASNTENHTWDQETAEFIRSGGGSLRVSGLSVGIDGTVYEGTGQFVRLQTPTIDGSNDVSRLLYDHDGLVSVVEVSPDNRILVSGDETGVVRVWNLNAQLIQSITVPGSTSRLRLSPNQTQLLIGSFGVNSAFVYDLSDATLQHNLESEFPIAWTVEFSPDGRSVATGYINFYENDNDTTLVLWDMMSGEIIQEFEGHNIRVSDMAFTPDGRYLLSSSQSFAREGELMLWDVETAELIHQFDTTDAIANVDITRDGTYALVTSYFERYIAVWDIETGTLLQQQEFDNNVEFSRLSTTDQTALVGLDDGRLLEVDIETLEVLRSFDGHTGSIWDIAISRDNTLIASGQTSGIAIIWNYETGREVGRIQHPGGFLTNLVFGPDDNSLFTSAYRSTVMQWSISNQSVDNLLEWVENNRYVRELTCEERVMYQLEPLCSSN